MGNFFKDVYDYVSPTGDKNPFNPFGGDPFNFVDDLTGTTSAREANQANIQMMREAMAWQERMSGTAHQREVADLQKAGLNPVLSAGGSGAPYGSVSPATMAPVPTRLQGLWSTAQAALGLKNSLQQTASQVSLNEGMRDRALADKVAALANAKEAEQRAGVVEQQKRMTKAQADWVEQHPNWFNFQKFAESVAPAAAGVRDLAISGAAVKNLMAPSPLGGAGDAYTKSREAFLKAKGAIPKNWILRRPE